MKFALVDSQRACASKGLKGICPICHQQVIAKCGDIKINHWAHKSIAECDKWWENETEWHRSWKDRFPSEWQEVIAKDEETGEKHIADIKTDTGLVIEFQHSYLNKDERISREKFYKEMVWVVDGKRCNGDFRRFYKAFEEKDILYIGEHKSLRVFILGPGNNYLPKQWQNSSVPVLFDFRGLTDEIDCYSKIESPLWCLLHKFRPGLPRLIRLDRNVFVEMVKNGSFSSIIQEIIDACTSSSLQSQPTHKNNSEALDDEMKKQDKVPLKACANYCSLNRWDCGFCGEKSIKHEGETYVVCNNPNKMFLDDYDSRDGKNRTIFNKRDSCPF